MQPTFYNQLAKPVTVKQIEKLDGIENYVAKKKENIFAHAANILPML